MSTTTFSSKVPPPWDDDKPFEAWKAEVRIWAYVTELSANKQGGIIALSSTGRKREVALELEESVLTSDDGKDRLMEKMETVFAHEQGRI